MVVVAARTKVVEPKLVNETIVFVEPGEGLEFVGDNHNSGSLSTAHATVLVNLNLPTL